MASALTLYCTDSQAGGSIAGTLSLTQPASSTINTGWTVESSTAVFSRQSWNVERANSTFGASAEPSGAPVTNAPDCWRTSFATSGIFSAGTWYSSLSVIAVTSGGVQDGRARFRIWRSKESNGANATEVTNGTMVGTTVTNLSTSVAQSSSASTFIASFALNSEYLYMQVAWEALT